MESFFHGKSSGLDPLNSYLSIPILIKSKDDINVTGIPSQKSNGAGAIFLIDSGKTGSTAPMVSIFMEKMKSDGFRKMISSQFIKHTNLCVDSFLNGDVKNLFDNTKKLSKIVFDNFKPMIPNEFHGLWKKGIDSGSYFLKLCGSGGGGYILGFAPDIEQAKNDLKDYPEFLDWVLSTDKNDHAKIFKQNIQPIETLFFEVGAEILKNISGYMAVNPDRTVQLMKKEVESALKDLKSGGNPEKLKKLKLQIEKLEAIGGVNAIVPTEGVVFKYKGKVYKFTGAFAPINQILGSLKFG